MATQQIVIDVPEKVLLAEKTDAKAFARELALGAASRGKSGGGLTALGNTVRSEIKSIDATGNCVRVVSTKDAVPRISVSMGAVVVQIDEICSAV